MGIPLMESNKQQNINKYNYDSATTQLSLKSIKNLNNIELNLYDMRARLLSLQSFGINKDRQMLINDAYYTNQRSIRVGARQEMGRLACMRVELQNIFQEIHFPDLYEVVKKLFQNYNSICLILSEAQAFVVSPPQKAQKPTEQVIQQKQSDHKDKINQLGGIHLYNQNYQHHIQTPKNLFKSKIEVKNVEIEDEYCNSHYEQYLAQRQFKNHRYGYTYESSRFKEQLQQLVKMLSESQKHTLNFINNQANQFKTIQNKVWNDSYTLFKVEKENMVQKIKASMFILFEFIYNRIKKQEKELIQKYEQQKRREILEAQENQVQYGVQTNNIFNEHYQRIEKLNKRITECSEQIEAINKIRMEQLQEYNQMKYNLIQDNNFKQSLIDNLETKKKELQDNYMKLVLKKRQTEDSISPQFQQTHQSRTKISAQLMSSAQTVHNLEASINEEGPFALEHQNSQKELLSKTQLSKSKKIENHTSTKLRTQRHLLSKKQLRVLSKPIIIGKQKNQLDLKSYENKEQQIADPIQYLDEGKKLQQFSRIGEKRLLKRNQFRQPKASIQETLSSKHRLKQPKIIRNAELLNQNSSKQLQLYNKQSPEKQILPKPQASMLKVQKQSDDDLVLLSNSSASSQKSLSSRNIDEELSQEQAQALENIMQAKNHVISKQSDRNLTEGVAQKKRKIPTQFIGKKQLIDIQKKRSLKIIGKSNNIQTKSFNIASHIKDKNSPSKKHNNSENDNLGGKIREKQTIQQQHQEDSSKKDKAEAKSELESAKTKLKTQLKSVFQHRKENTHYEVEQKPKQRYKTIALEIKNRENTKTNQEKLQKEEILSKNRKKETTVQTSLKNSVKHIRFQQQSQQKSIQGRHHYYKNYLNKFGNNQYSAWVSQSELQGGIIQVVNRPPKMQYPIAHYFSIFNQFCFSIKDRHFFSLQGKAQSNEAVKSQLQKREKQNKNAGENGYQSKKAPSKTKLYRTEYFQTLGCTRENAPLDVKQLQRKRQYFVQQSTAQEIRSNINSGVPLEKAADLSEKEQQNALRLDNSQLMLLIKKSPNRQEFKKKAKAWYNKCGLKCKHLEWYVTNFQKVKNSRRQCIILPIQNFYSTLNERNNQLQLPILQSSK